jgi:hypothetical protein
LIEGLVGFLGGDWLQVGEMPMDVPCWGGGVLVGGVASFRVRVLFR